MKKVKPMGTTEVLRSSIQHSQSRLAGRLAEARSTEAPLERPRDGYERIDKFLALTTMHLNAVDSVLVPAARRKVPDGAHLVHDYLRSSKALEAVLAHVQAHESGSVYEAALGWPDQWGDVESAMADYGQHEQELTDRLTEALPDDDLEALARRLFAAELAAPTRPHPYSPHTGPMGVLARRVLHTVDRFWDTAQGRMVPGPKPEPKRPPGPVGQYLLADPRFDEEEKPNP